MNAAVNECGTQCEISATQTSQPSPVGFFVFREPIHYPSLDAAQAVRVRLRQVAAVPVYHHKDGKLLGFAGATRRRPCTKVPTPC
jgi:hypothetical protein